MAIVVTEGDEHGNELEQRAEGDEHDGGASGELVAWSRCLIENRRRTRWREAVADYYAQNSNSDAGERQCDGQFRHCVTSSRLVRASRNR